MIEEAQKECENGLCWPDDEELMEWAEDEAREAEEQYEAELEREGPGIRHVRYGRGWATEFLEVPDGVAKSLRKKEGKET